MSIYFYQVENNNNSFSNDRCYGPSMWIIFGMTGNDDPYPRVHKQCQQYHYTRISSILPIQVPRSHQDAENYIKEMFPFTSIKCRSHTGTRETEIMVLRHRNDVPILIKHIETLHDNFSDIPRDFFKDRLIEFSDELLKWWDVENLRFKFTEISNKFNEKSPTTFNESISRIPYVKKIIEENKRFNTQIQSVSNIKNNMKSKYKSQLQLKDSEIIRLKRELEQQKQTNQRNNLYESTKKKRKYSVLSSVGSAPSKEDYII